MPTTSGVPRAPQLAGETTRRAAWADTARESPHRSREIRRILLAVLALNLAVAIAKLSYGYISGSVAMGADGFQSLLDAFANVIGLAGIAVAMRPPDQEHHF